MYLIFDSETSTFPSPKLAANHPNQARIVQLAWTLLDEQFKERACFNSLIRIPSSVRIHEGAKKAHGISEEDCRKYGLYVEDVLMPFFRYYTTCTIVAHNIKFDNQLIAIEHELLFGKPVTRFDVDGPQIEFCTMEAMTDICKLPFAATSRQSFGKEYKWPTLQEAHQHAFGYQFEGAHDALADVRATARLYKWLKEPKIEPVIPEPKINETYDNRIA